MAQSIGAGLNQSISVKNEIIKEVGKCIITILIRKSWNGQALKDLKSAKILKDIYEARDSGRLPPDKAKSSFRWLFEASKEEDDAKCKKSADIIRDHLKSVLLDDDESSGSRPNANTSNNSRSKPDASSSSKSNTTPAGNSTRGGGATNFGLEYNTVSQALKRYFPKTTEVVMPILIPAYFRARGHGYNLSSEDAGYSRKDILQSQLEVHPDKVDKSFPTEILSAADRCSRILNQMMAQCSVCKICRCRFTCNDCKLSVSLKEVYELVKTTKDQ